MLSLSQTRNRFALLTVLLCCLSFIKIPAAFAISNACNVSINKSRIDVSSWSTESFTITTSPNQFWLESFPINCTTTINGSWFDTATFNSTYDFGKSKNSNMVENLFMFGGSLREGSNEIKSCSTSISDVCSRTYVTGYKKIEVPGYVPPKVNSPALTPNSGSVGSLICTEVTKESKNCVQNINSTWSYENCWSTNANKIQLEKWNKSKKRFEKVKTFKIAKSKQCEKKYPKLVKFDFSETDNKNKTYRIKFIGDSGGPEEKVKVTFE